MQLASQRNSPVVANMASVIVVAPKVRVALATQPTQDYHGDYRRG